MNKHISNITLHPEMVLTLDDVKAKSLNELIDYIPCDWKRIIRECRECEMRNRDCVFTEHGLLYVDEIVIDKIDFENDKHPFTLWDNTQGKKVVDAMNLNEQQKTAYNQNKINVNYNIWMFGTLPGLDKFADKMRAKIGYNVIMRIYQGNVKADYEACQKGHLKALITHLVHNFNGCILKKVSIKVGKYYLTVVDAQKC